MANYPPKVLKNPSDQRIEFLCGGRLYVMEPGEEREFDGIVAYHALHMVNTGFVEVSESEEKEEIGELDKMKWADLLKEAGKYSWFKPGMNRQQLVEALENERTGKETQATGAPAPQEKAKGTG